MNLRNRFGLLFVLLSYFLLYTKGQFRVINGGEINIESAAHTVAILYNNKYSCVGSLIGPTWVLTAAHCVNDRLMCNLRAVAGVTNIKKEKGQRRGVVKIDYDRECDPVKKVMDIALITVDSPFKENTAVKIIELCDHGVKLKLGYWLRISGWGSLDLNDETPPTLLRTKHMEIQQCRNNGNVKIEEDPFLAETLIYAKGGEHDIGDGDSGAGGVWKEKLCAMVTGELTTKKGYWCTLINLTSIRVRIFIYDRVKL